LLLGDRYRALQPIGQGGFGKTFLAVDEYKPSQPQCVIKQFFPLVAGANAQKAAELFRREAARLDELGKHSQIPELLAHFEDGDRQYLVQEFIEGRNLEEELREDGTFDEGRVRSLLADLLPVLQFVHDRQVIHRDIKPENIIRRVARQGLDSDVAACDRQKKETADKTDIPPVPNLVIVDFGASKLVDDNNFGKTGTTIGSAGYVAPEQLAGKAFPASDLYNLGVTCVYLMTKVSPFELFDVVEGRWVWRMFLPTQVSHGLGLILDRLLVADVSQRYQSAAEVLTALEELPPNTFISGNTGGQKQTNSSLLGRMLGGIPQVIRGRIMQELGESEAAIASYDRALAIRPNNPDAWYKKGCLCYKLKRYEEALLCFEKTVKIKENHWQGWRDKGLLLYHFKKYKQAVDSYFKSLEIQPNQTLVWLWLSLAIKQTGDDKKAQMCLVKAKEILPNNPTETADLLWSAWESLIK
jgi:serine/threonine protein kinase